MVLRDGRVGALQRGAGQEQLVGAQRVGVVAAGDEHAEPLAVGVAGAALPRETRKRLRRLLVHLPRRGEDLVLDLVLRPGQDHLVLAARRRAHLPEERHRLLREPRERGHGGAQVARQATQLGLRDETASLAGERHERVERRAGRAYGRACVDDEPAQVREWLPVLSGLVGAKPPYHVPAWLGRLLAGQHVVSMMTEVRGGSNAKAREELGWQPAYSSWRQGFEMVARQSAEKVAA